MKFAATVFALAGCAYLARDVVLFFSVGPRVGSLLMAAFAIALLVQAYSLLRVRPQARQYGPFSSAVLAACFFCIVAIFVATAWPFAISEFPAETLSSFALVAGIAVAFGLAFISLLLDKHAP
jgi:hypothetical protein